MVPSILTLAPDQEYWAYASLVHSVHGEVCRTETYEFYSQAIVNFSLFTSFNFSCEAQECKYLDPGEECQIEVHSNHPEFKFNSVIDAVSGGEVRAQALNASNCEECGISWDLTNFCSVEGPIDLRLRTNPEVEDFDPEGNLVLYNPIPQDCRPGTFCYAELLNENISDFVFDNRPTELLVHASGINAQFDTQASDCDCFLGLGCNNQSCFNSSFQFEAGTTGACCGDDSYGGFESHLNRENFNFQKCPDMWDPENSPQGICLTNNTDSVCCNHVFDCVANGSCYPDDGDIRSTDLSFNGENATCSFGVWCPTYYIFNQSSGNCEWGYPNICYTNDPTVTYPTNCTQEFNSTGYWNDLLNSNPDDCFKEIAPGNVEACCPFKDVSGADFYQYEGVVIY